MQNKTKSWTDIQLIFSSISVAFTLGLWSLFASHEKTGAKVVGEFTVPSQPEVVSSAPPDLQPGQVLLLGGTAPQPQQIVVIRKPGEVGEGGGGGGGAPSTGSSKP